MSGEATPAESRVAAASRTPELPRVLGFRDVVLFFVVAVVGTRWIATAAAVGPSALVLWLVAFVALCVPLGFTVVELSSRHPQEGGLYVWTRRAFGDFAGFLAGWMYWTSNVVYFPGLLYFTAGNALYLAGERGLSLSDSAPFYIVASLAGLAVALGLNLVGLKRATRLHNAGATATWIPIVLLGVVAAVAWARFGPATTFAPAALVPRATLDDALLWSTLAFGFGGFEAASFMAEEIRDARRTIPGAIVVAGIAITAIYALGTAAVLVCLPAEQVSGLQGLMQATQRAADRIGWPALTPVAAALFLVSGVGGVGAWLGSVARLPFVAGVDRALPPAFGRLHPRWGTPHVSLWVQAAVAAAITLLGQAGTSVKGAYDALVSMGVIAYFVPFLFMFAAMIRLQREPAGPEVLRVPGGRPVAVALAALGFATTAVSIVLAVLPPPDSDNKPLAVAKVVGMSLLLGGIGAALYARGRRGRG